MKPELLFRRAEPVATSVAPATLLLAHGAGAPMDSEFMNLQCDAFAAQGIATVRFEFPYMAQRRIDEKRRPPDRMPVLLQAFRDAFDCARQRTGEARLFIGGKSMGGRVATLLAAEADDIANLAGVVCLGYPFHPPGKPQQLRTAHLQTIRTPVLICQGERDAFGPQHEWAGYGLADSVRIFAVPDGDHDVKPRKTSGVCWHDNLQAVADRVARFMG